MTNVLVVDSERSIRNTLKERLEYEGYRVETAETGGEAADKTEHSRFDVVLCDMAVPDIRAIDLLTSLHGSGKSTPFIMLSALKGLDPAIDSIRHGAFDYIPKPIDLNKLLRSIRSAVEDKSQNRATIETPSGKKSSAARAGDSARVVAKASCAPTEIVGTSVGIEHMKQLIEKVAPSDARVLITGDSGVGKSEAALELIRRGHQLVADDVVDICRVSDNRLTGECPEMVRHFMEIRGIGIIDIRAMYGIGAVAQSKSIDLVIHMEKWVEGKEYDRLGLNDEYITILGVKVPSQTMPVRPGRNLAIIIEVAARNLSMKKLGFSAARELDRRMNEMIMKRSNPDAQNQD